MFTSISAGVGNLPCFPTFSIISKIPYTCIYTYHLIYCNVMQVIGNVRKLLEIIATKSA